MTKAPTLAWDDCDREKWERLLTAAGKSPLEQSWSYGEALNKTTTRRCVVLRGGEPVAMVQVFERHAGPLRLAQIIRGPLWLSGPTDPAAMSQIRSAYRLRHGALFVWMPELLATASSCEVMKSVGGRRMTTGYSSAWIDLGKDEMEIRAGLHGKWRNALKSAEDGKLEITVSQDSGSLDWLLELYEEDRRSKRYSGPTNRFIRALAAADAPYLILRARQSKEAIAGILIFLHGASATYYVGWTGPKGRDNNAHNLLMWRSISELKRRGVSWLDVGGVNPAAPNVARFKLGMGGEFYTLLGSYI